MNAYLVWSKQLKRHGRVLGREGLSKSVIAAVEEFDGSYKGAMVLAGRLKAVSQAASFDGYWSEKVGDGFQKQREILSNKAAISLSKTITEAAE